MALQDRRRGHVTNLSVEARGNRICLSGIRNNTENLLRLHELANGHRKRLMGNISQRGKPAFPELLLTAALVQIDDHIRIFCIKIRRRIVKRQMSVLPNTRSEERRVGKECRSRW